MGRRPGHAGIAVPPTIQALLEARLDNSSAAERAAAEPAAVIGLEFPQSAVEALAPPALRAASIAADGAVTQAFHPAR